MRAPRLTAGRAALVLSALALFIAATGVTPSDAARAVTRALNADKVDGISASRTPKAGQLLPLGKDRRFPSSVLPESSTRGPRGAEGPAGPQGPSDGFITRSGPNSLGIPFGTPAIFATLQVPAGSYALDFSAHAFSGVGTTFIDCELSANGAVIDKTAINVGVDPSAVYEAVIVLSDAGRFDTPATVRVTCSTRSSQPAVQIKDIRLRAIRLGSLTEQ